VARYAGGPHSTRQPEVVSIARTPTVVMSWYNRDTNLSPTACRRRPPISEERHMPTYPGLRARRPFNHDLIRRVQRDVLPVLSYVWARATTGSTDISR
jgi:hypothetical protein